MITSKRQTPTTDDLLRRQEEPRKRHKPSFIVPRDEDEDSNASEDDDFNLTSEDGEFERSQDGNKWESEAEESTDSEIGEETSLPELGRLGRSDESLGLPRSRVTMKSRLVHEHTTSPGTRSSIHVTFSSLGISPPLLSALSKMAIHAPTEIQRACIPPLLAGLLPCVEVLDYR